MRRSSFWLGSRTAAQRRVHDSLDRSQRMARWHKIVELGYREECFLHPVAPAHPLCPVGETE